MLTLPNRNSSLPKPISLANTVNTIAPISATNKTFLALNLSIKPSILVFTLNKIAGDKIAGGPIASS